MSPQTIKSKKELRQEALAKRQTADYSNEDARLLDLLLKFMMAAPHDAHFASYLSREGEFDTFRLLNLLFNKRKDLHYWAPRVLGPVQAGSPMAFYSLPRNKAGVDYSRLETSVYGIQEPARQDLTLQDKLQTATKAPVLFMLVPALLLDGAGNRLGYGGGYYDRYLNKLPEHSAVCLLSCCRKDQFWDQNLPCTPLDHPVHLLVTAEGMKRCSSFPNQNLGLSAKQHALLHLPAPKSMTVSAAVKPI